MKVIERKIESLSINAPNLFLTDEKFSAAVESMYLKNKGLCSYLECIKQCCDRFSIDIDDYSKVKSLITASLKSKLAVDCSRKKMLKYKAEKKPLPFF